MGVVFAILAAVLVLLKLLGYITISWWWVVLPALVPLVFVLMILVSIVGFAGMAVGVDSMMNRRRWK